MATKQHSAITGSDLHVPKAHASSHAEVGADTLALLYLLLTGGTLTGDLAADGNIRIANSKILGLKNAAGGDGLQVFCFSDDHVYIDQEDNTKTIIIRFANANRFVLSNTGIVVTGNIDSTGTSKNIVTKTGAYTLTATDDTVLVNTNAVTLTLPAAASHTGRIYNIKKINTEYDEAVTIDGNSGETIDGELTYVIYDVDAGVTIQCDGSNWHVIGVF